jgi:hypothetical protein
MKRKQFSDETKETKEEEVEIIVKKWGQDLVKLDELSSTLVNVENVEAFTLFSGSNMSWHRNDAESLIYDLTNEDVPDSIKAKKKYAKELLSNMKKMILIPRQSTKLSIKVQMDCNDNFQKYFSTRYADNLYLDKGEKDESSSPKMSTEITLDQDFTVHHFLTLAGRIGGIINNIYSGESDIGGIIIKEINASTTFEKTIIVIDVAIS